MVLQWEYCKSFKEGKQTEGRCAGGSAGGRTPLRCLLTLFCSCWAVTWGVALRGLQPLGTFIWGCSLFSFFPISWWYLIGSLHTIDFKHFYIPSSQWNFFVKVIHPQTLFECLPCSGGLSGCAFWLLQVVLCPWVNPLLLRTSVFPSVKWGDCSGCCLLSERNWSL